MILMLSGLSLPPRAFKALGIEEIAYVKAVIERTGSTYQIHAADGMRLAAVEDRLVAFAMIQPPRSRTHKPALGPSRERSIP